MCYVGAERIPNTRYMNMMLNKKICGICVKMVSIWGVFHESQTHPECSGQGYDGFF